MNKEDQKRISRHLGVIEEMVRTDGRYSYEERQALECAMTLFKWVMPVRAFRDKKSKAWHCGSCGDIIGDSAGYCENCGRQAERPDQIRVGDEVFLSCDRDVRYWVSEITDELFALGYDFEGNIYSEHIDDLSRTGRSSVRLAQGLEEIHEEIADRGV